MSAASLNHRLREALIDWYPRTMLVIACVWFAQLYCTARSPYIDLARYAAGQERMPFQGRDLMRWPMLLASHSASLQRITSGRALLRSPELLVMEIAAAVSLLLAGCAAVKIYRLAAPEAPMPELPFALLIVICLFDFVLTVPFSFPYDLPATAFLGWGLYFALQQRFWILLPIFLIGTWNRETTLFLIGAVLLIPAGKRAAGTVPAHNIWRVMKPYDVVQPTILLVCWLAITQGLHHLYSGNPTEAGSRISGNLRNLANPLLWPNILSASAFLLPYVYLKRHHIPFAPLRSCLLLLPFWVLLLLSVGQVLELRIYGDISVLIAVAAALILTSAMSSTPIATG